MFDYSASSVAPHTFVLLWTQVLFVASIPVMITMLTIILAQLISWVSLLPMMSRERSAWVDSYRYAPGSFHYCKSWLQCSFCFHVSLQPSMPPLASKFRWWSCYSGPKTFYICLGNRTSLDACYCNVNLLILLCTMMMTMAFGPSVSTRLIIICRHTIFWMPVIKTFHLSRRVASLAP